MTDITVIKHLFILGITSIILNTILPTFILAGHISVVLFYGINSNLKVFSYFAAAVETIGVLAFFLYTTLTLVGSCLVTVSDKKKRIKGIVVSIVAISILSVHFFMNIILLIVSVVSGGRLSSLLTINGIVLVPIVVGQLILLIYNSMFVCVVGYSLRQVLRERFSGVLHHL